MLGSIFAQVYQLFNPLLVQASHGRTEDGVKQLG